MKIRKLNSNESPPMDLLLLADPAKDLVKEYATRGQCFVAEDNGQIIGVYILLPTRPGTVELVNIAVKKENQGNGTGKQLVQHAEQNAKNQGYKTMEIGTGNSSIAPLILYQKCGFRITGIDRDFFIRHYSEEIFENGIQCKDMIRLSKDL
ncbi:MULTISPECIES: GNAT family N-acetyltransferase [Bacillus]|uniref:GNAT family N-acetyltransferase n=1 Tax=Bacillus TaxID=1386 RepID=UPI00065DD112|nr:GNAT family N-acetyltransferase [Bacillus smithii]AKP47091.1 N-acetyltransferase [Bacillus smithii]